MHVATLGSEAAIKYTGAVDCLTQFKAGAFGPTTTQAAKDRYAVCLKTGARDLTAEATAIRQRVGLSVVSTANAGAYVPNCTGTYNPCTEIQKGQAAGKTITESLKAKCAAYQAQCGQGGEDTRYQTDDASGDDASGAEIFDEAVAEPWYMNKTYWIIGGVAIVGAALLLKR